MALCHDCPLQLACQSACRCRIEREHPCGILRKTCVSCCLLGAHSSQEHRSKAASSRPKSVGHDSNAQLFLTIPTIVCITVRVTVIEHVAQSQSFRSPFILRACQCSPIRQGGSGSFVARLWRQCLLQSPILSGRVVSCRVPKPWRGDS